MSDTTLTLRDRLDLLVAGGTIDGQVAGLTGWVLDRIACDLHLELTEENAGMFATHVAMALQRVKRGEGLGSAPGAVDEVIRAHPDLMARAEQLAWHIGNELGRPLPPAEVRYIALYLCALTEGDGTNA